MKRRVTILSTVLSLLAGTVLPFAAHAQASSRVYFSPATITASENSQLSLPIRLDPAGNSVNAVNVQLSFPAKQLSFVGLDKAGAFFDTIVPAQPVAQNGSVQFSAAKLGSTTKDDVLVANAIFAVHAASGSAQVSLSGSEAANAGERVVTAAASAAVTFAAAENNAAGPVISKISVANVTVNSGVVRWHTDVPASSSVDYGASTRYGFTAGSPELVTDHAVQLAQVFGGKTVVHYRITSANSAGQSKNSTDQTFSTAGYTIVLQVRDSQKQPLAGAKVRVGDSSAVTADNQGKLTVTGVAPGNQKVVINGGKTQFVSVKAVNGAKALEPQSFTLTAQTKSYGILYAVVALVLIVAAVSLLLMRRNQKPTAV